LTYAASSPIATPSATENWAGHEAAWPLTFT